MRDQNLSNIALTTESSDALWVRESLLILVDAMMLVDTLVNDAG